MGTVINTNITSSRISTRSAMGITELQSLASRAIKEGDTGVSIADRIRAQDSIDTVSLHNRNMNNTGSLLPRQADAALAGPAEEARQTPLARTADVARQTPINESEVAARTALNLRESISYHQNISMLIQVRDLTASSGAIWSLFR